MSQFYRTTLDGPAQKLLCRGIKFLTNVTSPSFQMLCERASYTDEAHEEMKRAYMLAAGLHNHLSEYFIESRLRRTPLVSSVFLLADSYQSTWFPRTRDIILRVVDTKSRYGFVQSFFENLEQEPIGPAALEAVCQFNERVAALGSSNVPAKIAVYDELVRRGLTPAVRHEIDIEIAEARLAFQPDQQHLSGAFVRVARLQADQRHRVEVFRDCFRDWSTTFRTAGATPGQMQALGLLADTPSSSQEASPAMSAPGDATGLDDPSADEAPSSAQFH